MNRRAITVYAGQQATPASVRANADPLSAAGRVIDDQDHPGHGDDGEDHERGRDPLVQEDRREDQDHQRLDRPQQNREAGGDGRQAEQTEGVGESWVEDAEAPEEDGAAAKRHALAAYEERQDDEAGRQSDHFVTRRLDIHLT